MLLTQIFALFALAWLSFGIEYDVDVSGDSDEVEVNSDGSVKINMINTMDEAVSIIWYRGLQFTFIMD